MNQELTHNMDIQRLFDEQQRAVGQMAKELAEREFELFELNMFISSSGEEHLNKSSMDIKFIREQEFKGKINLRRFEDLAEEY